MRFLVTPQNMALSLTNDYLFGFFNSVPQDRIALCVYLLLRRLSGQSQSECLNVNIQPETRSVKSISGNTKQAGDPQCWKVIDVEDTVHVTFIQQLWNIPCLWEVPETARWNM